MVVQVVRRTVMRETVDVEIEDGVEVVDTAIAAAHAGEHSDAYDREYGEVTVVEVWDDGTLLWQGER